MILKKIDEIYKNEKPITRSKASSLVIILLFLMIFCTFLTIAVFSKSSANEYLGYLLGAIFSLIFLLLLRFGFYKLTVYLSCFLFTLAISIGLFNGPLREYEITFLTLIIIFALIFSNKKIAYLITAYNILFFTFIYIMKREQQEFSSTFYIVSIVTMILLFMLSRTHLTILENYIETISRQKDSLEIEVSERTVELIKSKEYSETLFNDSPIAIYSVDKDNKLVNFNKKAEEITGYSKADVLGKEFNLIEKNLQNNEYKILTKDNNKKIIEKYSAILKDKEGDILGNIESFIDITNWKELELFKSDLERIIRHDLKTPLNSIIGFPKMMLTDESLSDENKEYLMIILSAGQNMLNLINASLDMYKLEEGSYQFKMEKTNVISILKQISNELREIRLRKKINIEIFLNGNPIDNVNELFIETEKSLFYMIITNIVKNALEASPKNEMIQINLIQNDQLKISVHNKGVIPQEIRDRFFEKYITKGKSNGNGLGTYSAKLMANAINAELDFTTDENEGTTLFINL